MLQTRFNKTAYQPITDLSSKARDNI